MTAVTKDRVLGHNPVAALYTAETYYKDKLKNNVRIEAVINQTF